MDVQWDYVELPELTHLEYEATPAEGGPTLRTILRNGDPMPPLANGITYEVRTRRVTEDGTPGELGIWYPLTVKVDY